MKFVREQQDQKDDIKSKQAIIDDCHRMSK